MAKFNVKVVTIEPWMYKYVDIKTMTLHELIEKNQCRFFIWCWLCLKSFSKVNSYFATLFIQIVFHMGMLDLSQFLYPL